MKRTLLTGWLLVLTAALWAQAPNGSGTYYKNADGKKGAALKSALCTIIHNHTQLSYKSLNGHYATTDMRPDNYLWDIYSNITSYTVNSTTTGTEGRGYNKEHTVPQSWFNGASPMYSDIFHVLPVDSWVNSLRSSYPYGETSAPTETSKNGYSKKGPCDSSIGYNGIIFEPNDEYKGDIARIYFYMVTCYENELKSSTWSGGMFTANGFTDWAKRMLLRWAENDPVSQKEIDRNNAVHTIQGNRNPFVDYPGLEQYIWGDMTNETFSYNHYSGAATETVAQPFFTPTAGTYIESVTVSISTATTGAAIYYTTDGSVPTASSTRYTGSITLEATTTVKAIAILDGESSRVATATYTIKQSGETEDGIIWAEDWSGQTARTPVQNVDNDNAIYSSGDDGQSTMIYNENLAGGTAPELLVSKNGYFQATIALGGVSGNLTLTFNSNRTDLAVTSSTTGVSISNRSLNNNEYTYTVYVPYGTQTLELKFVNSSSSKNARTDNFLLKSEDGGEADLIPVTLAFSVEEVSAILDEPFTVPTLIITPSNADIQVVYESDNPTVASVDATGAVTLLNEGVATIIASFEGDETYMACDDATYTLTVTHGQQSSTDIGVYAKITTASDLEDGKNYLLVYDEDSKAYAGFDSNKGIVGDVTITNNEIDMSDTNNEAQVLVLEKSGRYWLIKDGERYLALTSDAKTLASQNKATAAGTKWDITFNANGTAKITNVEHANYCLQYNTSGLFRCYEGTQKDPSFYKEKGAGSIELTIGASGYASLYYGTVNLTLPEGVEATTYVVSGGKLSVTKTYTTGDIIPAGTAVILYDGVPSAQTYTFTQASESGTAPETNMLRGFDENATTTGDEGTAYTYYMLAIDPDTQDPASIGFYYGAEGGAPFTSMAHKAYLAVPTSSTLGAKAFTFMELTGMREIETGTAVRHDGAVYSLSGQRMQGQSLPKGVYVREGKKVVIK